MSVLAAIIEKHCPSAFDAVRFRATVEMGKRLGLVRVVATASKQQTSMNTPARATIAASIPAEIIKRHGGRPRVPVCPQCHYRIDRRRGCHCK